MSFEGEV